MNNTKVKIVISIILLTFSSSIVTSCAGKYARNLSIIFNANQSKLKIEETNYIPGSIIANPFKDVKIKSGDGSMVTFVTGYRGKTMKDMTDIMIGFDKYIRHKIYFQLPALPDTGTYQLNDHSLIQLLGHYELSEASKIYLPISGFIAVDSINGNKMYGTVRGKYENNEKTPLELNGNFTVKM